MRRVQEAAARKGMALLPEQGLVDVHSGAVVPGLDSEAQVFERLGLPYVHPIDR